MYLYIYCTIGSIVITILPLQFINYIMQFSVTFNGKTFSEGLKNIPVTASINLTKFEAEIQPTKGKKYDLHIDVLDSEAVYNVDIDLKDPELEEQFNTLIKVRMKLLLTV